jgi:hypothetical protein
VKILRIASRDFINRQQSEVISTFLAGNTAFAIGGRGNFRGLPTRRHSNGAWHHCRLRRQEHPGLVSDALVDPVFRRVLRNSVVFGGQCGRPGWHRHGRRGMLRRWIPRRQYHAFEYGAIPAPTDPGARIIPDQQGLNEVIGFETCELCGPFAQWTQPIADRFRRSEAMDAIRACSSFCVTIRSACVKPARRGPANLCCHLRRIP